MSAVGKNGHGIFLDVETTGLSFARHEVVEVALVLFSFDPSEGIITEILAEYVDLREPEGEIPADAMAIHGITNEMVKGRRLDDAMVEGLLAQTELIIAHNASFDYGFMVRLYPVVAQKPWLCSMRQIDWANHGYASRALQRLLADHGIAVEVAHRAAADCHGALQLLNRKNPQGSTYLRELLASMSTPMAGRAAPA